MSSSPIDDQSSTDLNPAASSPTWEVLTRSRAEILHKLSRKPTCDLLVVGGGIAGASLARLAAFNGLRTVLLERGDYASETSGRSSKMAHGGLRYLEMLDLAQVREGVLCREDLFQCAPHLVRPHPFLIPVKREDSWARLKYGVGLSVYDLFARAKASFRHRWLPSADLAATPLGSVRDSLSGAYQFFDGIMDDSRLVVENILAARQEGAVCLNYAEFISYQVERDRSVKVAWRDKLTGQECQLTTGVIANCAGPWVNRIGRITQNRELGEVLYSRGIHLIFSTRWEGAALLLPMPEKGRVYFVWPHPGGTLVGTTEAPVAEPEFDPTPNHSEIEEILARLERDLPAAGLNRSTLEYAFAGIRTLPLQGAKGSQRNKPSKLSRRHRWVHTPGMLSLVGGKLTSAAWATQEGLKKIFALSDVISPLIGIEGRKYPGAFGLDEATKQFKEAAARTNVPPQLMEAALRRFGGRVALFSALSEPLKVLGGTVLRGEVELALRTEQVADIQDLMGRRLGLEYLPGQGLAALDEIGEVMQMVRPEEGSWSPSITEQKERYRARVATVKARIQG